MKLGSPRPLGRRGDPQVETAGPRRVRFFGVGRQGIGTSARAGPDRLSVLNAFEASMLALTRAYRLLLNGLVVGNERSVMVR